MAHGLGRGRLRRDADLDRIADHVGGELYDRRRHGRGEEERLSVAREPGEDAAHVVDEAHVEHAVRLVEDEVDHAVEAQHALLDEIEQSARGGDQHVGPAGELDLLVSLAHAAIDHRVSNGLAPSPADVLAVGGDALADLRRELAGRRDDERPDEARRPARDEMLQQRQHERSGLAGSGLRATEDVAPIERARDRLRLNRRRCRVAFFNERANERCRDPEVRESGAWNGNGNGRRRGRSRSRRKVHSVFRSRRTPRGKSRERVSGGT